MLMLDSRPGLDLDLTDFFCGIGGSSTGMQRAGWTIVLAANHSSRAIATHSANHPLTEHLCATLSEVDFRYLPRTRGLWASPICTELSPAGGRRRKGSQLDLYEEYGHVPSESFERTRATFWDVIRATEIVRYDVVIVENVVEAADWELFEIWLQGMIALGYNHQFVSVSAAHIGDDQDNPHAPQWRDRMYISFTKRGIPLPDLEPRPIAWCPTCDELVQARQWWKPTKKTKRAPGRKIGKYGPQYLYICPNEKCRHEVVEPYVLPSAAAIDWTDLGERIGDRAKPLGAATMRRIDVGLTTIGNPALVAAAGNTYEAGNYVRAWPALGSPTPAMTCDTTQALVSGEPFLSMLRRNGQNHPVNGEPAQTFSAGGYHHGLTIPPGAFISKHHGSLSYKAIDHMNKAAATEPMPSMTTKISNSLVIPYRKGAKPHRADDQAFSTMATKQAHGLLQAAVNVEDCYFRMLKPREAANAQRFEQDYILTGNQGEQQTGAGNAVACNVAQWMGQRHAAVLA
jgi:DNA (cytosine-5)-methyltransferase 1